MISVLREYSKYPGNYPALVRKTPNSPAVCEILWIGILATVLDIDVKRARDDIIRRKTSGNVGDESFSGRFYLRVRARALRGRVVGLLFRNSGARAGRTDDAE